MELTAINISQIEISGEALSSCLKGFPEYLHDIASSILYTHDIGVIESGAWYNFSNYLQALQNIGSTYGEDTLFAIGKQALFCAKLPEVNNFSDALNKIEHAFTLNHRNGDICKVLIETLDVSKKKVNIWIENPYPYQINRGILTAIAREYNPIKSKIPEVIIDENKSIDNKGFYRIVW